MSDTSAAFCGRMQRRRIAAGSGRSRHGRHSRCMIAAMLRAVADFKARWGTVSQPTPNAGSTGFFAAVIAQDTVTISASSSACLLVKSKNCYVSAPSGAQSLVDRLSGGRSAMSAIISSMAVSNSARSLFRSVNSASRSASLFGILARHVTAKPIVAMETQSKIFSIYFRGNIPKSSNRQRQFDTRAGSP
jgi:hypothetical protein